VWDLLNLIGERAGRVVIELDEVQEIASITGTFQRALANLFNTHPGVTFAFSGSYFGISKALLEPKSDSPLFGRSPASLRLEPFSRDYSIRFLEKGLDEYHLAVPRETLATIIDRSLGGVPGWLTLFGTHVAVERMDVPHAETATLKDGKRVARSELSHFLEGRRPGMHWDVLRTLVAGASWVDVRNSLTARSGAAVNDNTVRNVLRSLIDGNLVERTDHTYRISDPMVRAFVQETRRPPAPSI
jgi:hypothetical protein